MKDRNVQHASRFRLTKVPGTDDVYDLIPAPGEVYDEGTLINKSALLKDATAALFGLDENAVPDDAIAILSRFHNGLGNEYVWAKSITREGIVLAASENRNIDLSASVQMSSTCVISGGSLSLVDPVTKTLQSALNDGTLLGKYFINIAFTGSPICYVDSVSSSSFTMRRASVGDITETSYVNSADQNAYPPAVSDGYTYTALGRLGEKAQIETGSYVGTGTYGSSNPNSLTFDFVPKLLFIFSRSLSDQSFSYTWGVPYLYARISNSIIYNESSVNGNTLTWYNTANSANNQLNVANAVYDFIVIY